MFDGKKIIITQGSLHGFSGSEIVTIELAEYFQQSGANVIVFTRYIGEPMESEFKKRKIKVVTDEDDSELRSADYVWVHHQILPRAIIEVIGKETTKFIFLHMSALEEIYLEQPYIYNLENQLSCKSLFMAPEAKQLAKKIYFGFSKIEDSDIFPNPVPSKFLKPCSKKINLRKILIVSNHPAKEVNEACDELRKYGIKTQLLGAQGDAKLISPEILNQYDLVITVAKSVQYCLTLGVPVYLYDHFGGPGYLNLSNLKKAAFNNFSGRGFTKKSAEEIAEEIIKGFSVALEFQSKNRGMFAEKYSLENNLNRIFKDLKTVDVKPFSKKYLNYVLSVEALAAGKIIGENVAGDLNRELEKMRIERDSCREEYEKLINSRTVRTVRKITKIIKPHHHR